MFYSFINSNKYPCQHFLALVRRKRGGNIFGSRGVIGRCRSVVLGCRGVVFCGSGVVSLSLVGDFSHKTFVAIGVIGDMLDTTIRQVDRVGSLHVACSVAALTSAEHSLGVVVGHGVAVGVGKDLVRIVGWFSVVGRLHWGVVGRGSVVDRSRGMVDNWGRGMVGRGSMDNSMVSMADAVAVSNSVSDVGHMRHCGSAGQTKQGRDHEGLKK